jgi:hypothetical protein
MLTLENLEESIRPITASVLEAGFTVYALKDKAPRKAGFVYVCLDTNGPFATIQQPTFPNFEPTSLDVPIKPSRDYGSSVLVDYDNTVEGAVEALRKACESPNVTVRFVAKRGQSAPVVPNYGRNVLDKWPGGLDRFDTVTADSEV